MKLRWYIEENDRGKYKPDWPKSMSFGKPWQQFIRTKPKLQHFEDGDWHDVPVYIHRRELPLEKP